MLTPTTKKLFKSLLKRPDATLLHQELSAALVEEQGKRQNFYDKITDEQKVEFIHGEWVVHSPVLKRHNDITSRLLTLSKTFVSLHQLGYVGYEKVMISLTRNDYEPDVCFFSQEKAVKFTPDQSRFPAPDFVVEVLSKGTEKNDRGIKFEDYQAHQVQEYWMVDPKKAFVEQYRLSKDGLYELLLKSGEGMIEIAPIKGFQIPIKALFDDQEMLKALQNLLK